MSDFYFDSELMATLNGQRIGSSKRIELLENIYRFGSISQAAKAIPMSYKAAWDAVNELNQLATEPLVIRHTGGQGGGQSILTAFGRHFVADYRRMQIQHQQIMQQLQHTAASFTLSPSDQLLPHDNQLTATISHMVRGSINHEIQLSLPQNQLLIAQIPASHSQYLGLAEGQSVCAFIQASAIILARPTAQFAISARNQLQATIGHIHMNKVNSIIECHLAGGLTLNALITRTSAENMALKPADSIILLIKAPSVLLTTVPA
ncbi:TOBE domain-containing protein [Neisseriaceae bacterium ESL0693]|nr:TOBE domain-containing protein [Neisseriaceae bacterium ESL0693]